MPEQQRQHPKAGQGCYCCGWRCQLSRLAVCLSSCCQSQTSVMQLAPVTEAVVAEAVTPCGGL